MNNLHRKFFMVFVLFFASAISGCANNAKSLYQWGGYENHVYGMIYEPGKIPPDVQLQNMEKDYETISSANAVPPPGYLAHLGYLYFQAGKKDQALQSFEAEKKLFPESAIYMDRMIAHLKH